MKYFGYMLQTQLSYGETWWLPLEGTGLHSHLQHSGAKRGVLINQRQPLQISSGLIAANQSDRHKFLRVLQTLHQNIQTLFGKGHDTCEHRE